MQHHIPHQAHPSPVKPLTRHTPHQAHPLTTVTSHTLYNHQLHTSPVTNHSHQKLYHSLTTPLTSCTSHQSHPSPATLFTVTSHTPHQTLSSQIIPLTNHSTNQLHPSPVTTLTSHTPYQSHPSPVMKTVRTFSWNVASTARWKRQLSLFVSMATSCPDLSSANAPTFKPSPDGKNNWILRWHKIINHAQIRYIWEIKHLPSGVA